MRGCRSALLLTTSFNENDFQVVSGGLLILSVLIPNVPSFAQRLRELAGRRRLRSAAAIQTAGGGTAPAPPEERTGAGDRG